VILDRILHLRLHLLIFKVCEIIILGQVRERGMIQIQRKQISKNMLRKVQMASCSQEQLGPLHLYFPVLVAGGIIIRETPPEVQKIQTMSCETFKIWSVLLWVLSCAKGYQDVLVRTHSLMGPRNSQVVFGWVEMAVRRLWEDVLLSPPPLLVDGYGHETWMDNSRRVPQLMIYKRTPLLPRPILLMAVKCTLLVLEPVLTILPEFSVVCSDHHRVSTLMMDPILVGYLPDSKASLLPC
jgi:hypothetical protein